KPEEGDLWKILQATYKVLNETHPNLTQECWLCYTVNHPFYEAIGVAGKSQRLNGTNPARCLWKNEGDGSRGITLAKVTGKGRCVG
ncbi:ENV1 protein, partial [Rhodinocichla rosea]|nr:ENV1 protein [Rhodinocichla rosea]